MNKDFARGMIVSMALKALPVRKKSPIAYLYNGVRLPALPEWDREAYPYAAICSSGINSYYLRLLRHDAYYETDRWGEFHLVSSPALTSNYLKSSGWSDFREDSGAYISPETPSATVGVGTIWTNFDLLNEDETVFMEATDPIPVYE